MKIGIVVDKVTMKFLLVGILNTLVGTLVMFFAYNGLHLSYWVSSALNYVVGSVVSYVLNRFYTFKNTAKEKGWRSILLFSVNILLCYLIAYGISKPLIYLMFPSGFSVFLKDNFAMLSGMCIFILLNYCGQRYLVFRE